MTTITTNGTIRINTDDGDAVNPRAVSITNPTVETIVPQRWLRVALLVELSHENETPPIAMDPTDDNIHP